MNGVCCRRGSRPGGVAPVSWGKRLTRDVQRTQRQRPAAGRTPVVGSGGRGSTMTAGSCSWGAGCGGDVGRVDRHYWSAVAFSSRRPAAQGCVSSACGVCTVWSTFFVWGSPISGGGKVVGFFSEKSVMPPPGGELGAHGVESVRVGDSDGMGDVLAEAHYYDVARRA
jgi:hypothetical protein